MKSMTVYEAEDGRRFDDAVKCAKHEILLAEIESAMRGMPDKPKNAGVYITASVDLMRKCKERVWALVLNHFGDQWPKWRTWDVEDVHPGSMVGRVLGDSGSVLYNPWCVFMCCDFDRGRIYDQPYFVSHPAEAKALDE